MFTQNINAYQINASVKFKMYRSCIELKSSTLEAVVGGTKYQATPTGEWLTCEYLLCCLWSRLSAAAAAGWVCCQVLSRHSSGNEWCTFRSDCCVATFSCTSLVCSSPALHK